MVRSTNAACALPPVTAKSLGPEQRRDLALPVLTRQASASQTARDHGVSRKFVARQAATARAALDEAFDPPAGGPDAVLFWLPVTKARIGQGVLGLTLICHSSLRGASEFCRDALDYPLAHTTARHIVRKAVATAQAHTAEVDLSRVRIGALDELFQHGRPVLVGADADPTYCYLPRPEQHRDADTWGVRLLELADRGFAPDATVADFAGGLRAGQAEALPQTPCRATP